MKLAYQVVSLELAKKLKELGVKQESAFYWIHGKQWPDDGDVFWLSPADKAKGIAPRNTPKRVEIIAAFTVAELGDILPQVIKLNGKTFQLFISVGLDKQWFVVYANEKDYHDNAPFKIMFCHSEADARAKMLIHLIEKGIVKA